MAGQESEANTPLLTIIYPWTSLSSDYTCGKNRHRSCLLHYINTNSNKEVVPFCEVRYCILSDQTQGLKLCVSNDFSVKLF